MGIVEFLVSREWWEYVFFFGLFCWIVFYNQSKYLADLKKNDPAKFKRLVAEHQNKTPWFMPKDK